MKVLHLITRIDRGGSADNTILTCLGQKRHGCDVTLATGPGRGEESPLKEKLAPEGIPLVRLPSLVREIHPLKELPALWACFRLIRKGKFDLVHTHTSKAGILGRLAAWLAGAPRVVHTPHGHVFYGYFGSLKTRIIIWAERMLAKRTDAIVTLTDREAEEHLAAGVGTPGQFVTIFSGVPLPEIESPLPDSGRSGRRKALRLPPEGFLIGSVGRLDPVKGHGTLIRAFAGICERHPHARLILAGEGENRAAYESLAEELGVRGRVSFLGWREDVGKIVQAIDLFVLPSLNEGLGRAVLEAMAAGLPVVASRVGGVPELAEETVTGLLVPAEDPAALGAAIERMIREPGAREAMGLEGRRRAKRYSTEAMCEMLDSLYRRLLDPAVAEEASA